MRCDSCGMPMVTAEEHGGGIESNKYCRYCTDADGNLKGEAEVRDGMIKFTMKTTGKSREEAEDQVKRHMREMPAWKGE
jgi:hypothetical protein